MRTVILSLACLVALALVAVLAVRSFRSRPVPPPAPQSAAPQFTWQPLGDTSRQAGEDSELAAQLRTLCSTCHVFPPADVEPKWLWPGKIEQMFGYIRTMPQVAGKPVPPIDQVTAYWVSRAPEQLTLPPDALGSPPSPLPFRIREITLPAIPSPASVSCVRFVQLSDEAPVQLLISDMRQGTVVLWDPGQAEDTAQVVGRMAHPCRTHVVDLDGDGLRDILVANLGDYWPVDTDKGTVVWLRNRGQGRFDNVVLADGLGRVNEVDAADFDGDGDLDVVVAVFGNLTTGMILYLENLTEDYGHPDFEGYSLDGHTGTSDVPGANLNGDGRPDFVALQAQQHERIAAFLNVGKGRFNSELIYAAPHPRWGSTGIRLLDFDSDGDLDVLFNHGDSVLIPPVPRPYHGVSWLENRGVYPFTYHRLAHMPGAHTSLPGDLDGDGDLDLACSAFIPAFDPNWPVARNLDSVAWLQQTAPGQFTRYAIQTGTAFHPCGDLGDLDADGDLDIVLGNFFMYPDKIPARDSCLTIVENARAPGVKARP